MLFLKVTLNEFSNVFAQETEAELKKKKNRRVSMIENKSIGSIHFHSQFVRIVV